MCIQAALYGPMRFLTSTMVRSSTFTNSKINLFIKSASFAISLEPLFLAAEQRGAISIFISLAHIGVASSSSLNLLEFSASNVTKVV